jgi:hypothetical protein
MHPRRYRATRSLVRPDHDPPRAERALLRRLLVLLALLAVGAGSSAGHVPALSGAGSATPASIAVYDEVVASTSATHDARRRPVNRVPRRRPGASLPRRVVEHVRRAIEHTPLAGRWRFLAPAWRGPPRVLA